jgi:hypothetical protein
VAVKTDHWVSGVFYAVDARDTAAVMKLFADDPTMRFGNAEPAVGREQVEAAVAGFFAMVAGLRHEITGVWTGTWPGGEVRSIESDVTYTRHDGSLVGPLPATTTLRLDEIGRIKHYQIFMDVSPLFA